MPFYDQDFQEVSHCGANTTIHLALTEDGRKQAAFGIVSRRPGPMVAVGVYILLPHGEPVSDFKIGGIGQPFDPPMPEGTVPAFLGSDSLGCWGHQCPRCDGYFRNENHAAIYPQTCPYCGMRTHAFHFLTPAQRSFLAHLANTLAFELGQPMENGTEREVEIDMAAIVDQSADEPKPDFYYASETQQTRYKCDHCSEFNDIRGIYGYCAACGWRNNFQMLSARFDELRDKLNSGHLNSEDAVGKAVSQFDATCRDFATQLVKRIPMKPGRKDELARLVFHDIESETFSRLKTTFDINPLKGIQDKDIKFIKMMLERRHLFEHNSGVVDARYVERSGDPDAKLGLLLRESKENAHIMIGQLARMAANVDRDFHEIFTPTEWPIKNFDAAKERSRRKTDNQNS